MYALRDPEQCGPGRLWGSGASVSISYPRSMQSANAVVHGTPRRLARAGLAATAALTAGALVVIPVSPASAAGRPITPEYVGIQDDLIRPNQAGAWGSARMYAKWCLVQKDASLDPAAAAESVLGGAFRTHADMGVTRLTVSFGHPAAWFYDNHPAATANSNKRIWFCGGAAAGGTFPSVTMLRSAGARSAYQAYVAGVISAGQQYLAANPTNKIVLQAWNEPNLLNGGAPTKKIPGAARTWKQASDSLREQERILRAVASSMIPGRFEITSPSLYGKKTQLNKYYFKAQAKSRTVDSISLNFYTLRQKSVNKSLALWKKKAATAKKLVTKYKKLRRLPIWITETNHNLINGIPYTGNVTSFWAKPGTQKRLVEVTTMEALRQGYAGIQWYQGAPVQTAVNTQAGSVATAASTALMGELVGRRVSKCTVRKSTTTCRLTARPGSGAITVRWSKEGSAGVSIF